jgi:predicted nuclease with TOPRIM domain
VHGETVSDIVVRRKTVVRFPTYCSIKVHFLSMLEPKFNACRATEMERDELRDETIILKKKCNELQESLDALQEETDINKEALIGRIQFLSLELDNLDKDSRQAVRAPLAQWYVWIHYVQPVWLG